MAKIPSKLWWLAVMCIAAMCANAQDDINEDAELEDECAIETGVDSKSANELLEKEMMEGGEVPENVMCYARCFMTKKGMFEPDGELIFDGVVNALGVNEPTSKALISEALQTCKEQSADTKSCSFAYKLMSCLMSELIKLRSQD